MRDCNQPWGARAPPGAGMLVTRGRWDSHVEMRCGSGHTQRDSTQVGMAPIELPEGVVPTPRLAEQLDTASPTGPARPER